MTSIDTVAPLAAIQDVHRAAHSIRRHLEHEVLAPHDLTWTLWSVLWVAWRKGEIEAYELALEAGVAKPTLSGALDTLETRGLAIRTTHPDDRRRVLVSLTPAGEALMSMLLPLVAEQESELTSTLTPDERRVLWTSLRKIVAMIDAGLTPEG